MMLVIHCENLNTAVAFRDQLHLEWGANPSDDEKFKLFMDHTAKVEGTIRFICGLVQAVDAPPVQIPGPQPPGDGEG